MKKFIFTFGLFSCLNAQIQQAETLYPITYKINKRIFQITVLGDSHIQAGSLVGSLREGLQKVYGDAGFGTIFPYEVALSNGPIDYSSTTNTDWTVFRSSHPQSWHTDIGLMGWVLYNTSGGLIEIDAPSADYIKIFSTPDATEPEVLIGEKLKSTKFFQNEAYTLQNETWAELAAKFYTTTTRLKALNGSSIMNPTPGRKIKVERTSFDPISETSFHSLGKIKLIDGIGEFPISQSRFILKYPKGNNILYGIQLLKKVDKGIIVNGIGINGATYADFLKNPRQIQQISQLGSDLIIIALGTNESLGKISPEEFGENVTELIDRFQQNNPETKILLLSPAPNLASSNKLEIFSKELEKIARLKNLAFLDMYRLLGKDYFKKALKQNQASNDGIHFKKLGYQHQGNLILKALLNLFKTEDK